VVIERAGRLATWAIFASEAISPLLLEVASCDFIGVAMTIERSAEA